MRGARTAWRRVMQGSVIAGLLAAPSWAASGTADPLVVDPEAYYAVTYVTHTYEAQIIKPVKVVNVVMMGGQAFLVVDVGGPQRAIGYLALNGVRTILPVQGFYSVEPSSSAPKPFSTVQ